MKMTLKDCIELPVFCGAEVLTKKIDLAGKKVRGISVMDRTDSDVFYNFAIKEDELLLSSSFGLSDDFEKRKEILKELSRMNVAGLIIFNLHAREMRMPDSLISYAEDVGVPLITISEKRKTDYGKVINSVMERLLHEDSFENRLISNTIFHLLNFEKHTSFQSAAREAAISNNFQLILLSEDFNPVFAVETRHEATIDDAIKLGMERDRDIEKSNIYTMIDVNGVLTYWGPVKIDGKKHYMFIVDNEDSYSASEITKLAEILELAMGMWKYTPKRDTKKEFVKALRRGNRSLAYSLREEAGFVDYKLLSVFSIMGGRKDFYNKMFSEFEESKGLKIIKLIEDGEISGVITCRSDNEITAGEIDLFEKFGDLEDSHVFHVTGIDDLEGAATGFKLINETAAFAKYIFPIKRLFSKYELALAGNCMNISMQGGAVKKNYQDLIGAFRLSKEIKDKQLLETLTIFVLDAGMSTGKTAKLMNVHTNTIQYRLKRIRDILGVDITGGSVFPGLTTALAIERMEKVIKGFN